MFLYQCVQTTIYFNKPSNETDIQTDRSIWINRFIKLINVIAVSCLEDCSKILLRTNTLRCINTRCGVHCTALLHNYLPVEGLACSQALQTINGISC